MSTESSKTVYLVSGANRGIGLGLVTSLASRSDAVVYAGARDPTRAPALDSLSKQYPGQVHIIKLTSSDVGDNAAAVSEIKEREGQLDVVIANAGISKYYGPLATTPLSEFQDHWNVNALGVVVLFQAVASLLLKSRTPKFIVISTAAASIGRHVNISAGAYASSKAAVNFIVKQAHSEHEKEGLVTVAVNPGWVQTDMGNQGAIANGMEAAPVTLKDSVEGILKIVDNSQREAAGGKFLDFATGDEIPW